MATTYAEYLRERDSHEVGPFVFLWFETNPGVAAGAQDAGEPVAEGPVGVLIVHGDLGRAPRGEGHDRVLAPVRLRAGDDGDGLGPRPVMPQQHRQAEGHRVGAVG